MAVVPEQKNQTRNRIGVGVGIAVLAAVLLFVMCPGQTPQGVSGTSPQAAIVPAPVGAAPTAMVAPTTVVEGEHVAPVVAAAPAAAPAPVVEAAKEPPAEKPIAEKVVVDEIPSAPVRIPAHAQVARKSGGGRMVLLQHSEMRGLYDIISVSYTIDDTSTYGLEDVNGLLNSRVPFVVLDTVIAPGPHRVVARMKIRGGGTKPLPYMKTVEVDLEHAFHFTADVGTDYQLVSIFTTIKGATMKYEDKPDVIITKVTVDLGPAQDTSAVTAQAEDSKATRLVVLQHNEVRTKYRITGLTYTLDGKIVANMQDESVNLDDQTPLVLFDARMTPGSHHVEVRYRLRGATDRALSYIKASGEFLEKQYDFELKAGIQAQLVAVVSAKEGATATEASRPEVTFTFGSVSAAGRLPPPVVAAIGK
jgi:hypothetical protein